MLVHVSTLHLTPFQHLDFLPMKPVLCVPVCYVLDHCPALSSTRIFLENFVYFALSVTPLISADTMRRETDPYHDASTSTFTGGMDIWPRYLLPVIYRLLQMFWSKLQTSFNMLFVAMKCSGVIVEDFSPTLWIKAVTHSFSQELCNKASPIMSQECQFFFLHVETETVWLWYRNTIITECNFRPHDQLPLKPVTLQRFMTGMKWFSIPWEWFIFVVKPFTVLYIQFTMSVQMSNLHEQIWTFDSKCKQYDYWCISEGEFIRSVYC